MNRLVRSRPEPEAWPLQDAKAHFSAVVDAAMRGKPQRVTRRGKPAVVVVAAEDFDRLARAEHRAMPGLIDYLCSMPAGTAATQPDPAPRMKLRLRDVDLSA